MCAYVRGKKKLNDIGVKWTNEGEREREGKKTGAAHSARIFK